MTRQPQFVISTDTLFPTTTLFLFVYELRLGIGQTVDIDLNGIRQVSVYQRRRVPRDLHRLGHVALELSRTAHDLHGAAAQHVGRPDHHRIADARHHGTRLVFRAGDTVGRLLEEIGRAHV